MCERDKDTGKARKEKDGERQQSERAVFADCNVALLLL
jgi:hypothetical protein